MESENTVQNHIHTENSYDDVAIVEVVNTKEKAGTSNPLHNLNIVVENSSPSPKSPEPATDEHGIQIEEWDGDLTKLSQFEVIMERLFKIRKRKTTIRMEIYCGLIQFISCLYVLPVVPQQMARASYNKESSIVATAGTCALGCIAASILTNLPFIIAPPTSVSIFLAVFLQQQNMIKEDGNMAVVLSGIVLVLIGFRPIGRFVAKMIPDCIQASTSVGIGLITALAGATEINLVVKGKYTILDMGPITSEVTIAMFSLIIVAILLHYHVKGAFCMGLIVGTIIWWIVEESFPLAIVSDPHAEEDPVLTRYCNPKTMLLFFDLAFLYVLTLNGLSRSLSDLGHLTKPDGSIPHGRWLFIVCGATTIISGFISGPPIIISPESAAGIKAGAKTGLSTLICGILFAISTFFSPIFAAIPAAGTAPLLLMVGVLLFQNVRRIEWSVIKDAVPAFCVLFFIPFTYSILRGVAFGYVTFGIIGLFTGDLLVNSKSLYNYYAPWVQATLASTRQVRLRSVSMNKEGAKKLLENIIKSGDYKEDDDALQFTQYEVGTGATRSTELDHSHGRHYSSTTPSSPGGSKPRLARAQSIF